MSEGWTGLLGLTSAVSSEALARTLRNRGFAATGTRIVSIAMDPEQGDDGVLCQLEDGRVFVALSKSIWPFAMPGDPTALEAFNRAFESRPDLFRGPLTPRASQTPAYEGPGFIADLTDRDRERMYSIIRKNHWLYFADHPTKAQMDNLIEGLGMKVIEDQLRRQIDAGRLE